MNDASLNTDLLTASYGRPIAWAYGKHAVAGNVLLRDDTDPAYPVTIIAHGEGIWDGYELLNGQPKMWLNGVQLEAGEVHFHNGYDGQLSSDGQLTPESTGGDGKVDLWFPAGVQRTTFSRTAYAAVMFNAALIDPSAWDFVGIFRCRRLDTFDGNGNWIDFVYSENPAWQVLDLLRKVRKWPDNKFDWSSFATEAAYCDALINVGGQQVKRFVSHPAFVDATDLSDAVETVLDTCRGALVENGDGVLGIRIAKARATVFAFTAANIVALSMAEPAVQWKQLDTRGAANRLEMSFRDPDNDQAIVQKQWNHELHQVRTGRITSAAITLPGMPQHQAERVANYRLTRQIDLNEEVSLRGWPATLEVMPGDVVSVTDDAAPWDGAETFEVEEATDEPDGTREFLLRLYRATAYSDVAGASQNLSQTTIRKTWPGAGGDVGVPAGITGFSITSDRDGFANLQSIVAAAPVNMLGLTAGTLTLRWINEIDQVYLRLSAAVLDTEAVLLPTNEDYPTARFAVGDSIVSDLHEAIKITGIANDGTGKCLLTVERGKYGTTKQAMPFSTRVDRGYLDVFVVPMRTGMTTQEFGDYYHQIWLPGVRIFASELYVSNQVGDSAAVTQHHLAFDSDPGTQFGANGVRTNIEVGGYVWLVTGWMPGADETQEEREARPVAFDSAVRYVHIESLDGAVSGTLFVQVYRNGVLLTSASIQHGQTESVAISGALLAGLKRNDILTIAILGASATAPGGRLRIGVVI